MIRVGFVITVLFMLPLTIWCAMRLLTRVLADEPVQTQFWETAPLGWLALAGALLSLGGLAIFATLSVSSPGGVYQPPVLREGGIEPGRIK